MADLGGGMTGSLGLVLSQQLPQELRSLTHTDSSCSCEALKITNPHETVRANANGATHGRRRGK
jgi:hypothetical protein